MSCILNSFIPPFVALEQMPNKDWGKAVKVHALKISQLLKAYNIETAYDLHTKKIVLLQCQHLDAQILTIFISKIIEETVIFYPIILSFSLDQERNQSRDYQLKFNIDFLKDTPRL